MTQHQAIATGRRVADVPFQDLVIGAADPGYNHLYQKLTRARLGVGHLIELE
jgi:hypothetical protein